MRQRRKALSRLEGLLDIVTESWDDDEKWQGQLVHIWIAGGRGFLIFGAATLKLRAPNEMRTNGTQISVWQPERTSGMMSMQGWIYRQMGRLRGMESAESAGKRAVEWWLYLFRCQLVWRWGTSAISFLITLNLATLFSDFRSAC